MVKFLLSRLRLSIHKVHFRHFADFYGVNYVYIWLH